MQITQIQITRMQITWMQITQMQIIRKNEAEKPTEKQTGNVWAKTIVKKLL
jgi:hypothetical protein